ncbi:hypothetical protein JFT86_19095 [Pseudomonas sp. TH06]|uniref:hypothetical protein n=1 Tax=Pseudomonas sp. TH06 TaxID=2796372 RepID=UPI0019138459|nr:hypothetical protein [Pseudomonas sp. TH06]MBK5529052.1 hypothetical protein [Pseudomonas sp. TH06]
MPTSPLKLLAKIWVKAFNTNPYITAVVTSIISAILTIAVSFIDQLDRENRELKRLQNNDYQLQIEQLSNTETNLKQLLSFVKNQQTALRETEDTIAKLKSEKAMLQPLVDSNKAVVEAFFRAQEERTTSGIWRERLIGFGLGLVASLLASLIWYIASILLTNKKSIQPQPTNPSDGERPRA